MSDPHDVLVAAGVLVRDRATGAVLLQLRGDDATWGLPGGRLEPGESLEQAARRELLEETGLAAGDLALVDVYSGPEFVVRYPMGTPPTSSARPSRPVTSPGPSPPTMPEESAALAWYQVDELPVEINPYNRLLLRRVGIGV